MLVNFFIFKSPESHWSIFFQFKSAYNEMLRSINNETWPYSMGEIHRLHWNFDCGEWPNIKRVRLFSGWHGRLTWAGPAPLPRRRCSEACRWRTAAWLGWPLSVSRTNLPQIEELSLTIHGNQHEICKYFKSWQILICNFTIYKLFLNYGCSHTALFEATYWPHSCETLRFFKREVPPKVPPAQSLSAYNFI